MRKINKTKRLLCAVLAVAVSIGFAGCGQKEKASDDGKVLLRWIMPGVGKQTDSDKVWAEFNNKLKTYEGMENVTVEFEVIANSDYKQKVMLMQTGGTQMDIMGTYTLNYADEVRNETFLDVTDMMDEYAPDIKNSMPEWALEMTQVDGRQYVIPNYQQMAMPMWSPSFHADNAEKYLDAAKLEEAMHASDILSAAELDLYDEYLTKLKENGVLNLGIYPGSTWAMKGYAEIASGGYVYRLNSDKIEIQHTFELDTIKMLAEKQAEWFKKGFIRKDVLSAEKSKGTYDITHENYNKYIERQKNSKAKRPYKIIPSQTKYYLPTYSTAGGNGVTTYSKNPEKALMLLNLMYSEKGKDLYRLLAYGIEGEHYKKISDTRIETLCYSGTQPQSDSAYGLNKWLVGNTALAYETQADPEGWNDYVFNDWNANAVPSKLTGITIDLDPIDTEITQVKSVYSEYINQITSGAMTDLDATYKEAMAKLEAAGNSKVKQYLQEQVDKFLAENK